MMYMSTNWFPFDAKTHVVASEVQRERVGRANPFRGEREVAASLRADGGIFIKGDVYHGFE